MKITMHIIVVGLLLLNAGFDKGQFRKRGPRELLPLLLMLWFCGYILGSV